MSKSNATEVIARFAIIGFLISLPIGLPAVFTGAISLAFLAVTALFVALIYNGLQWLGHRLLFGGTPEYEDFKAQGKDAWFDHSAPWPFRSDDEVLVSSEAEPRARWRCEVCHAEVSDLDQPCWNCGVEWLCPNCGAPVADEFATCDHCGNNPLRNEAPARQEALCAPNLLPRGVSHMRLDVADCEVLALDTGVIDCPTTGEKVPVLFMTVRITGQGIVNLAIRNPRRLKHDVPLVIRRSTVLNGGKFVPESPKGGGNE